MNQEKTAEVVAKGAKETVDRIMKNQVSIQESEPKSKSNKPALNTGIIGSWGVPRRVWECTFKNDKGKAKDEVMPWLNGFLILMGDVGTGKTHLAIAAAKIFWQNNMIVSGDKYNESFKPPSIEFLICPEMIFACQNNFDMSQIIIDDALKPDLLVLDDLGIEKVTDFTRQLLYLIINKRYNNLKSTIITTNRNMQSISENINQQIAIR